MSIYQVANQLAFTAGDALDLLERDEDPGSNLTVWKAICRTNDLPFSVDSPLSRLFGFDVAGFLFKFSYILSLLLFL